MKNFLAYTVFFLHFAACYSFKGISIPPEIRSFSIEPIEDPFYFSPATYPVDLSETLLNKIRRDTRLILNSGQPDLVFRCRIVQFEVNSQAPQPGIVSAINRCTVGVEVEMENLRDEKQNWKANFTRYQDFDAATNFSEVEQQLTAEINRLIAEDIYNRAFTNW